MSQLRVSLILCCVASSAYGLRLRREAVKDDKKTDLKLAESRVFPYGGLEPFNGGYGGDPYHTGLHGLNGFGPKPIGLVDGPQHYYRSGISDGLVLGGRGAELYSGGSGGHYGDGSFLQGHHEHDGGYRGLEGYRDDKHHVADDYANRGYYSGAHGLRKDLGNGETFDKSHGFTQSGINSIGDSHDVGHLKGHHKNGFRKSYHKDESGNDESYYDSNHDEGNHALDHKLGDHFSTSVGGHNHGGHKLNEYDTRHHGQDGFDGSGKLLAVNHGVRDFYGNNGHYGANGAGKIYSNFDKYGVQGGHQNGFNGGRNFNDYRGNYGPVLY